MGNFAFNVPSLGSKFKDYRSLIMGDSFNWSWVRPMSQVRYLAIHHTAGPASQTPQQIAAYHVQSRGWGGIGYHFLIGPEGNVYYVGDLTTARANVANYNDIVIGICLIGNFTGGANPTSEQIRSAHELCAQLLFRTPELPGTNGWEDMVGHKQFNATACPGDNWESYRAQIINLPDIGTPSNDRVGQIANLYTTVLGRAPDAAGLESYANGNMSIDQIRAAMVGSPEHAQLINRASLLRNAQTLAQEAINFGASGVIKDKLIQITRLGQ